MHKILIVPEAELPNSLMLFCFRYKDDKIVTSSSLTLFGQFLHSDNQVSCGLGVETRSSDEDGAHVAFYGPRLRVWWPLAACSNSVVDQGGPRVPNRRTMAHKLQINETRVKRCGPVPRFVP